MPGALPRPLPLALLALSSAFLDLGAADSVPSAPAAFFLRLLPRSQLKARRRPDAPERDFFLRGGPPGPPDSSAAGAAGGARAAMALRADLAAGSGPLLRDDHALGGRAAAAGDAPGEKFGRRRPSERGSGGRREGPAGGGGGGRGAGASRREGARGGSGRRAGVELPTAPPRHPGARHHGLGASGLGEGEIQGRKTVTQSPSSRLDSP